MAAAEYHMKETAQGGGQLKTMKSIREKVMNVAVEGPGKCLAIRKRGAWRKQLKGHRAPARCSHPKVCVDSRRGQSILVATLSSDEGVFPLKDIQLRPRHECSLQG